MSNNPPTNENIIFPNGYDSFPTVYDAGDGLVSDNYTRVWAEYHNKIRNFIGVMEPLLTPNTAFSDGTLEGLAYTHMYRLNPAPTLNHLIRGFAKDAYDQGYAPPSSVLPFEIVITSSTANYSNWPNVGSGVTPLLYKASPTQINQLVGGGDLFTIKPMVQCVLSTPSPYINSVFASRWMITSHVIPSASAICIRGAVVDVDPPTAYTGGKVPRTYHFPNSSYIQMQVSILGVRT